MINEIDLIGTKWYMKNSCSDLEDEVLELGENNELICMGNPREVQSWQFKDHLLILYFNNGYAVYTGMISGESYNGNALNIMGDKWTFKAYLIKPKHT